MRDVKSEEITSVLGERGLVRCPYRSCMTTLKGWTFVEAESKVGECEQEVGREGGGRATPKPQKGVGSPEGRGSRVGGRAERSGKGWRGLDREGGADGEGEGARNSRDNAEKAQERTKTRMRTRKQRDQGSQRREAEEGAGVRRPKQAGWGRRQYTGYRRREGNQTGRRAGWGRGGWRS
jgi:hypothetical protein